MSVFGNAKYIKSEECARGFYAIMLIYIVFLKIYVI